jgi:hypothetical protein
MPLFCISLISGIIAASGDWGQLDLFATFVSEAYYGVSVETLFRSVKLAPEFSIFCSNNVALGKRFGR